MTTAVPADSDARRRQLWRFPLGAIEVLLAVAAVIMGTWCWHHGIAKIVTPAGDGRPPLVSSVLYGNWAAGAIGLCALGALLLVDAVRQLVRWAAHLGVTTAAAADRPAGRSGVRAPTTG